MVLFKPGFYMPIMLSNAHAHEEMFVLEKIMGTRRLFRSLPRFGYRMAASLDLGNLTRSFVSRDF